MDAAQTNEPVPGLMNVTVGDYHVGDVEISAAFNVNAAKVGRDVAEATYTVPNNTYRFADVGPTGVVVRRGRPLDALGCYLKDDIEESDWPETDVREILADTRTDVVVSYLPVEHRGIAPPHYTSPPLVKEEFAEFCPAMIGRYASDGGLAPQSIPARSKSECA
jgi:myo-inositol-1-phosphate synthase